MSEFKRVAFIGLGQMGLPMATHLLHGGFQVVGFDLSEEARSASLRLALTSLRRMAPSSWK